MIEFEPEIKKEYDRYASELDNFPEDVVSNGLTAKDVLQAHFLIANHFYIREAGLGRRRAQR
jgi:hypothetical protein